MSNHDGSYILNEVLLLLERYDFFKSLTQKEITDFVKEVIKIGDYHDCNNGEIFNDIGKRVKYCYYCGEFAEEFDDDGLCKKCTRKSSD